MRQPWIIALISTDYDLKDERKGIIEYLEEQGITVSAFEKADYPVIQDTHSHDNCLQVLKRADIAILIINKRYGGKYYLNENISITEEEYNSLDIPKVVLVNEDVWNERAIYRRQKKDFSGDPDSFKFHTTFAEDIAVFEFIDNVQDAYSTTGRTNWMNYWKNYQDLINKIPLVLQALSVNYVKKIIEEQIKEVKARKTSTAFSMSLGDVFENGYYIEPEYEIESGRLVDADSISKAINAKIASNESCMIVADAGAGKTTLVAKSFLELAAANTSYFNFPIYVWLKGKGSHYSFSTDSFLDDCYERYFRKLKYPFFCTSDFQFTFFLDGFDELTEKLTLDDLDKIYESEMFQWPVVLTSRIQYAERYMQSNNFNSKFSCRIKIKEWSENTAKRYISNFCQLQGKTQQFERNINGLIAENEELSDILKSPLLITVLLYVIDRNRMTIPETITSRVTLLQKCLELLAQREIENKISHNKSTHVASKLVLRWAYLAWFIYEERLKGGYGVRIDRSEERIKECLPAAEYVVFPDNIYDVIFDVFDNKTFGTFHEQILEYLVAYCLAYACKEKCNPYPDFLKYIMRPEINRYFRGIVEQDVHKHIIIDNIYTLFMECAGSTDNEDIAKRVHAAYHLSRISGVNDDGKIDRIFNFEKERAVLQSLYFGVIKKGQLNREKELYQLLINDEEYSNSNRGYHLAYYDSLRQKEIPFKDDSSVTWSGTLKAFLRHFSSTSDEHYYLRRIDLVTMKQLMESHGKADPLTDESLAKIEYYIFNPKNTQWPEFQKCIEDEFDSVKKTYTRLQKKL